MELFGSMPDAVKFIIVFLLILGILVLLLWRRFNIVTLGPVPRAGRPGRLSVVEMTPVDVRHRLVLVKRDNVEHLLLVGGPSNIVVESNIARGSTTAREPRPIPDLRPEAGRQQPAAEAAEWSLPLEPMARPVRTVDLDAALPEPAARTAREAMVDSMRAVRSGAAPRRSPPIDLDNPPEEIVAPALTPPPGEVAGRPLPPEPPPPPVAPPESKRQPAPEDSIPPMPPVIDAPPEPKRERMAPPMPRPVPASPRPVPSPAATVNGIRPPRTEEAPPAPQRPAPPVAPPAPPSPRPTASDESNLAEMAQRLEAALRRPTKPEPPPAPPPVRPSLRPERPDYPVRKPANLDAAGHAKTSIKSPDSSPPDLKILSGKGNEAAIESLEDEMARMLGRPGKS